MLKRRRHQQTTSRPILHLKWGEAINAGWTAIPNTLIMHAADLKLSSLDLHIVQAIASHWWSPELKPFVSNGTIGGATGVHANTVRRRIKRMEILGYVRRVPRHSRTYKNSNGFLLDGLVAALQPLAAKAIHDRKIEQEFRASRKQHKRPSRYKLKVVKK